MGANIDIFVFSIIVTDMSQLQSVQPCCINNRGGELPGQGLSPRKPCAGSTHVSRQRCTIAGRHRTPTLFATDRLPRSSQRAVGQPSPDNCWYRMFEKRRWIAKNLPTAGTHSPAGRIAARRRPLQNSNVLQGPSRSGAANPATGWRPGRTYSRSVPAASAWRRTSRRR